MGTSHIQPIDSQIKPDWSFDLTLRSPQDTWPWVTVTCAHMHTSIWFQVWYCFCMRHRRISICIFALCFSESLFGSEKVAMVPSEHVTFFSPYFIWSRSDLLENSSFFGSLHPGLGSLHHLCQVVWGFWSTCHTAVFVFISYFPVLSVSLHCPWCPCSKVGLCVTYDSSTVLLGINHIQAGQFCSLAELNKDLTFCLWPFWGAVWWSFSASPFACACCWLEMTCWKQYCFATAAITCCYNKDHCHSLQYLVSHAGHRWTWH